MGISEKFNGIIYGIRHRLHYARLAPANAAFKRTQSKACGLFDTEYLLLEMHQALFLRLQKLHKTSHDAFLLIGNKPHTSLSSYFFLSIAATLCYFGAQSWRKNNS